MAFLDWFKKKEPQCRHFKEFGEKMPDNMVEIVRFSPYETDTTGYGIRECTNCQKRAFSCMGLHLMPQSNSDVIDAFNA